MPEQLRVGIIGCGNVGARLHLPAWLAHPEVAQVVGVADPTAGALEAARTAAGLPLDHAHSDALDLIRRDDVDAVDICTPQHLRRDILLDAISAGKHILCEKPIAAVPADASLAVKAAGDRGVTLAIVHNYLWLPEIQAAQRIISSGEIGDVRVVIVNFLGVPDLPGTVDFDADWRHDPARSGGGVLIDMLHGVYVAEALVGEPLQRVSAYVSSREDGARVEDIALCRYETAAKAALVNIGWGHGPGGIDVCGTDGRISIRYENGGTAPWALLEHVLVASRRGTRFELTDDGSDRGELGISRSAHDSFEWVVADFADAVLSGRNPASSGAAGERILEATLAAYESAATGELVDIPLDRSSPLFEDGVLGLRRLVLPDWSPLNRRALFTMETVD